MSNIFTKLRDFVGFNEPMDYEYEYDEMDGDEYQNLYQQEHAQPAAPQEDARTRRPSRLRERAPLGTEIGSMGVSPMGNVIGMPGVNGVSEVVVMEPRSFEEMPQAIQALRERKSVVLNLTIMDPDQAQRAVDFVAGGTYAIDGHQERIGESIFLFTPSCVQVSTQGVPGYEAPQPQQPQVRTTRQAAPTPAWASEQMRMAQ
ncbi:cell division protein SepF [Stenomitos frigidus ULC18]|uniref:Cell division protein SepF n=2 Tax=Stenomitos TaxID=1844270 RepID=A0A2T1ECF9_9CYAN|nr:cell division protein SepF [Stenomitos frigidus ULC18]